VLPAQLHQCTLSLPEPVTRNRNSSGVKSAQSTSLSRHFRNSRSAAAVVLSLALGAGLAAAQAPGGGAAASAAPAAVSGQNGAGNAPGSGNSSTAGRSATTRTVNPGDRAARDTDQNEVRPEVPAGSQDRLTEFQQMVEATSGRRLPIFGASIFEGVPTTFAPIEDVPVGPGYILGPGDELRLQLSGQVDQQLDLTVDRTGAIAVPGLGAVHVAGLAYTQLPAFLNSQLGKIYRNFSLSVNLGALRSIQVFVVGNARRPGSFSISSMSTLTNAIFASGGPLPQGTLRDIQVQRDGKTIVHFDLYDLLLKGDKSKDIPLATGDVIFIPPVGPQVAIVGSVNNPAIYELKGVTTLNDLVRMAGGETSVAGGSTVRLERVFEHSMLTLLDAQIGKASSEPLQNGDIVSVTSIIDRFKDAVTLRGNVANPGRYVWHPGMRISDLIPNKDSLITRNYWRKRNLLGQLVQDYQPDNTATSVQSEGALQLKGSAVDNNAQNLTAKGTASGDPGGNSVGAALTGNNSIFDAKTDIVLSAPDIDWSYAVIERQSSKDLTTSLIPFNLGKIILDSDPTQNYELFPGDVVTIFSKADIRVPSAQQTRFVRLEGEFNAAGVYSVQPGETLRGLLRRAGGFTPDAYLYASEFTRESTRRVEVQRLNEYADELEAQISSVTAANQARAISPTDQLAATASAADAQTAVGRLRRIQPIGRIVLDLRPDSAGIDSVPDLALEDGDRFVVPRVPSNVNVQGQVYSANAFVYTPGERVINYMRRAGGPDRQADRKRTFILRADGSVVSRQYANVERAPIYPGDTIVVPPVIDKRALFQRVVDIASIVGNFALGVAAIDIIARQ
jgi:polysaccharide export outer membrane protein